MDANIVLLPGDGIGPEVVEEARRMLDAIAQAYGHTFNTETHLFGGCAIDETGQPLPESTLEACLAADAVLLGAVGGPKWSNPSAAVRPEQGLLGLRKAMSLFANLRPVSIFPEMVNASPLKPEKLDGVDILFVRELTGGVYFGEPRFREQTADGERAVDTMAYTESEVRHVARLAFQLAEKRRGLLTSVDKANVLESSRLWRRVVTQLAEEFPDVELEHQLVDSMTMRLIQNPASLDVVVTTNMFGDILTDESSVLAGSLGMLPSASLGEGGPGLYEPIHGSAPDIAGKGLANPIGQILSAAMMLRESLNLTEEAAAIEAAVAAALADGARTADLGGATGSGTGMGMTMTTTQMGDAIRERL